jgi:hypothetical protein
MIFGRGLLVCVMLALVVLVSTPVHAQVARNAQNRVWRRHDGCRSKDSQPLSVHRGFWSDACSHEGGSPAGTEADSWNLSRADLWALEKSSRCGIGLRPPLQSP